MTARHDNPSRENVFAIRRVPCPVCGAKRGTGKFYDIDAYRVYECFCGHWYLGNRLPEEEMLKMYASDEYFRGGAEASGGYVSYEGQELALRLTFRRMVKVLEKRKALGGRLLEIGCGYGYFLREARDKFDYVAGTEFSAEAARKAAAHADAIYHGGLKEAAEKCEKNFFDMVVAIEVLEHVYDPLDFLCSARELLRRGGFIVISVPNAGSLYRTVMGKRWPSWKLPEHVSHFTKKSLFKLLRRAGYIYLHTLPTPHAYPLGLVASKLGIGVRLPRWLEERPFWIRGNILTVIGLRP